MNSNLQEKEPQRSLPSKPNSSRNILSLLDRLNISKKNRISENSIKNFWGESSTSHRIGNKNIFSSEKKMKKILEKKFGLEGQDLQRVTELVLAFSQGVKDTDEYHKQRNVKMPIINFYFIENTEALYKGRAASMHPHINSIIVNMDFLKDVIKREPFDEEFIYRSSTGKLFEGTHIDFLYYAGVEEADHSVYYAEFPKAVTLKFTDQLVRGQYDANPIEYRWLETALQLPKTQTLPKLKQIFMDRLYDAQTYIIARYGSMENYEKQFPNNYPPRK